MQKSEDEKMFDLLPTYQRYVETAQRALETACQDRNHRVYSLHVEWNATYGELANAMGVSRSTVQGMMRSHGQDCYLCDW